MDGLAPGAASAPTVDDCWNRIGVRGDRSCPLLAEHVHCRNCPVFAGAARDLLDREVPADYVANWTTHFAEAKQAEGAKTSSAVVFRLQSEWFALPTQVFDEITVPRRIHSLPHQRSPSVLGLVNVRGRVIICISFHRLLGIEGAAPAGDGRGIVRARLVVIRHASGPIAVPVDEVQPTVRFDEQSLKSVPATIKRAGSNYTSGILAWRDRQVGYLDAERILQAVNRSLT